MPLTHPQQEVMAVLRQPGTYLYAYKGNYAWCRKEYWRGTVQRRTHGCLVRAGLIERTCHPDLAKHEPGMPVWVWVATPSE